MNIWANAVVTDKGLSLLAKLTQGNTLDITRAVTGSGFVAPVLLNKQTEITSPQQSLTFKSVSYPETGKCAMPVTLTNEGLESGYDAMQVGVFARDPDAGEILFFIAQSERGTPIPSETEMPGYSAEWTFYFQYGQADSVNVTVDPSNTITEEEMKAEEITEGEEEATEVFAELEVEESAEPAEPEAEEPAEPAEPEKEETEEVVVEVPEKMEEPAEEEISRQEPVAEEAVQEAPQVKF